MEGPRRLDTSLTGGAGAFAPAQPQKSGRALIRVWVEEAVAHYKGSTTSMAIRKYIWKYHAEDLYVSGGNLFYTWQEDIKSATLELRKKGVFKPAVRGSGGVIEFV